MSNTAKTLQIAILRSFKTRNATTVGTVARHNGISRTAAATVLRTMRRDGLLRWDNGRYCQCFYLDFAKAKIDAEIEGL